MDIWYNRLPLNHQYITYLKPDSSKNVYSIHTTLKMADFSEQIEYYICTPIIDKEYFIDEFNVILTIDSINFIDLSHDLLSLILYADKSGTPLNSIIHYIEALNTLVVSGLTDINFKCQYSDSLFDMYENWFSNSSSEIANSVKSIFTGSQCERANKRQKMS